MGRVETDAGATLTELLRLDHIISVDKQPGRLAVTAKGPLHGKIEFGSRLSAGALDAAVNGWVHVWPQAIGVPSWLWRSGTRIFAHHDR